MWLQSLPVATLTTAFITRPLLLPRPLLAHRAPLPSPLGHCGEQVFIRLLAHGLAEILCIILFLLQLAHPHCFWRCPWVLSVTVAIGLCTCSLYACQALLLVSLTQFLLALQVLCLLVLTLCLEP